MAAFRLIVEDVERALVFYRDGLGFEVVEQYAPAMAILRHEGVEVWVAGPPASACRPMPDGEKPVPGGWNRVVIRVSDLEAEVQRLRGLGVAFRNEIVSGPGGKQIRALDGVGNVVELFEAR
jgi:catechol 2,3-dioxygenase-like lactoylglutathione lyase family enzyme